VPYVRTVKTSSGATAVQIVYSSHRGSREIEHLGSAHSGAEVELLKAVAWQRLAAGQGELDLGLAVGAPGGPLPITASRMGHLWDALMHGYRVLGFDGAAGGDEVFTQLVLARIIEPTSKLDSARVLEEAGISAPSYRTLRRPAARLEEPPPPPRHDVGKTTRRHRHLAVLDAPGRAGVLPLPPGADAAFLQIAGLIHHQHRSRITQLHDRRRWRGLPARHLPDRAAARRARELGGHAGIPGEAGSPRLAHRAQHSA
jgi:hypothetical protein